MSNMGKLVVGVQIKNYAKVQSVETLRLILPVIKEGGIRHKTLSIIYGIRFLDAKFNLITRLGSNIYKLVLW